MAETSGFFDATWDETVTNPETGELGDWVPRYLVKEFTDYFSLFVGNGVFISPVNQCKVIPGTGLSVIVTEGWAFINGMWYHNDGQKQINLVNNQTSNNRVDSIRLRYSEVNKSILALSFTGDTDIVRGEATYDLKLADVIVPSFAVEVSAANITDTRPNEAVCGFVKGLLEVVDTKDLFSQYQAMFDEWFDDVKDQLTGDLAIQLQLEFDTLNANIIQYKADTDAAIAAYVDGLDEIVAESKTLVTQYKADTDAKILQYKNEVKAVVDDSNEEITDFIAKDFLIPLTTLNFSNKACRIDDARITSDTLVDVYFTQDTVKEAMRVTVYVNSYNGYIELTSERQPSKALQAKMRVRVY